MAGLTLAGLLALTPAGGCVSIPTEVASDPPPAVSAPAPWLGLFELALALAREERPAFDPRAARARLQALALRCEAALAADPSSPAQAIAGVVFHPHTGLRPIVGEPAQTDPRAYDMGRVLETGRGACLPLTLVVLAVCEGLGLQAQPLLSPTHAMVWIEPGVVLDPALGGVRLGPEPAAGAAAEAPRVAGPDKLAAALLANRAAAYRAAGRAAAARLDLERALELAPESYTARLNLAALLLEQGETGRARELLEQLEGAGAATALVAYNLGVAAAREGLLGVARTWYEEACERDPGLVAAHVNLGAICLALGDRRAAARSFAAALALDPDNVRARAGLARSRRATDADRGRRHGS